jgi:two-component system, NtrC family, nitrogen regulation sensor histidine kinase NtrY
MFKNFRLQLFWRIGGLCIALMLATYLALETAYVIAAGVLALSAIVFAVSIVRLAEKAADDTTRFLEAIRYDDMSLSFRTDGLGRAFDTLNQSFQSVLNSFKAIRAEREETAQYLQTIVQHIGVGIIVYRLDGTVDLMNAAAKRLLGVPQLKNLALIADEKRPAAETLLTLTAGEKTLIQFSENDELVQLIASATAFRRNGETLMLASLQNIQPELEAKELESWQSLIRVLTHEMMNSITPIASLASTAKLRLETSDMKNGADSDALDDVRLAIETIERRSNGLIDFTQAYRTLTKIPAPAFAQTSVEPLLKNMLALLAPKFSAKKIAPSLSVEPTDVNAILDAKLIEQVLVNLLLNALDAVDTVEAPRIALRAFVDEKSRVTIEVEDNGGGIAPDVLPKIFIPFFTTKPNGNGIGLSLSRQIMRQHGGTLSVRSSVEKGSIFTLRF